MELPDGPQTLLFAYGQLFLAGLHPLADRLRVCLAPPPSAAKSATLQLVQLRLAETWAGWRAAGLLATESEMVALPSDAVGPLAISPLLMEATVRGLESDQLLAMLGGEDKHWQAFHDEDAPESVVGLEEESWRMLQQLARPQHLAEMLKRTGATDQRRMLELLCRLWTVDLVRQVSASPPLPGELMTPDLVQRFVQRIADDLQRSALDLPAEHHRAQLSDLLPRVGALDHYELLGIEPTGSDDSVYEAYRKLARFCHPSHAKPLRLGSRVPLEMLFERATEAYLVLSDPDRRSRYNREHEIDLGGVSKGKIERQAEQHKMARLNYQHALQFAEAEQYHYAIELLRVALRLNPKPEYYALLGSCLSHNPNWLGQAAENYRRALELQPKDAALHASVGEIFERMEDYRQARRHFQAALDLVPGHPDAASGLDRVAALAPAKKPKRKLFAGSEAE